MSGQHRDPCPFVAFGKALDSPTNSMQWHSVFDSDLRGDDCSGSGVHSAREHDRGWPLGGKAIGHGTIQSFTESIHPVRNLSRLIIQRQGQRRPASADPVGGDCEMLSRHQFSNAFKRRQSGGEARGQGKKPCQPAWILAQQTISGLGNIGGTVRYSPFSGPAGPVACSPAGAAAIAVDGIRSVSGDNDEAAAQVFN